MKERKDQVSKAISSLKEIIDLSNSFWKSKILMVANELDVFSKLSASPETAKDLSKIMKTNPRATELLLNSLKAMGLLKKEKGYFSNTEVSKRYLCQGSPSYIGFALRHYNYCWDSWTELGHVIRKGRPTRFKEQQMLRNDERRTIDFTLKMDYTGWKMAPEIARVVDLSEVRNMLELGGGSGCYSIYLCKKYSNLRSTIFELPLVAKIAEENVKKHKLQRRIRVITGDVIDDTIKGQFDLVFISFLIHGFSPKDIYIIFRKARSVLKRNGRLVVQEYALSTQDFISEETAIFNILMYLNTNGGRAYTLLEIKDFFNKTNFNRLKFTPLSEKSAFIVGRKPYLFIGYAVQKEGKVK